MSRPSCSKSTKSLSSNFQKLKRTQAFHELEMLAQRSESSWIAACLLLAVIGVRFLSGSDDDSGGWQLGRTPKTVAAGSQSG